MFATGTSSPGVPWLYVPCDNSASNSTMLLDASRAVALHRYSAIFDPQQTDYPRGSAMRVFLLTAICAASMLCASFASDQALVPSKPVAELGYRVSPDFFD